MIWGAAAGALAVLAPVLPGQLLPFLALVCGASFCARAALGVRSFAGASFVGFSLSLGASLCAAFLFLDAWPGFSDGELPVTSVLIVWSSGAFLVSIVAFPIVVYCLRSFPIELRLFLFVLLWLSVWRALGVFSLAWWWTGPELAIAAGPLRGLLGSFGPILAPAVIFAFGACLVRRELLTCVLALNVLLLASAAGLVSSPVVHASPAPARVVFSFASAGDPFDFPPAGPVWIWAFSENALLHSGTQLRVLPVGIVHAAGVDVRYRAVRWHRGRVVARRHKWPSVPWLEVLGASLSVAPDSAEVDVLVCYEAAFPRRGDGAWIVHSGSLASKASGWRARMVERLDLRHSIVRAVASARFVVRVVDAGPSGLVRPDGVYLALPPSSLSFPVSWAAVRYRSPRTPYELVREWFISQLELLLF